MDIPARGTEKPGKKPQGGEGHISGAHPPPLPPDPHHHNGHDKENDPQRGPPPTPRPRPGQRFCLLETGGPDLDDLLLQLEEDIKHDIDRLRRGLGLPPSSI
nr:E1/E4 fusion protein [Erethizon dorsatum papillomavirus 1]